MPKKYWALLDIQLETMVDGFTITLTTNTPCHLFMRWTLITPQQHGIPVYRRGITMHADKYFCFDVYRDNEQEEAGDTLTHTFIKADWPICETRYFYFHGTIDAEPSPSTTAIFKQHFKGVEMYVSSLGKLTEEETLHGHVKLKEGAGVTITRVDEDNALQITAAAAEYQGFGNDWQWYASTEEPLPSGTFRFDEMRIAVTRTGRDYRLYTKPHFPYSLTNHQTLMFKGGRVTPTGGTPEIVWGITTGEHDVLGNLNTEGIWFRVGNSMVLGENSNGTNRTSTLLFNTDMGIPFWLRWERDAAEIRFYLNRTLYATHTTNLPTASKNCIFVFQIKGVDNFSRTFAITRPEFSRIHMP